MKNHDRNKSCEREMSKCQNLLDEKNRRKPRSEAYYVQSTELYGRLVNSISTFSKWVSRCVVRVVRAILFPRSDGYVCVVFFFLCAQNTLIISSSKLEKKKEGNKVSCDYCQLTQLSSRQIYTCIILITIVYNIYK